MGTQTAQTQGDYGDLASEHRKKMATSVSQFCMSLAMIDGATKRLAKDGYRSIPWRQYSSRLFPCWQIPTMNPQPMSMQPKNGEKIMQNSRGKWHDAYENHKRSSSNFTPFEI